MRKNSFDGRDRILFYTRPCYLDAALEYINLAKSRFDLYVIIQLSDSELKSNILNLNIDVNNHLGLVQYETIKEQWDLGFLANYFEGCNVSFAVFGSGMFAGIKQSLKLIRFIETIKPSYIHFDDFTGKQALLLPYLLLIRSKLILNIHDPKPHSGEFTISRYLIQNCLYKLPRKLVFFSKFSADIGLKSKNQAAYSVKLLPYTVFSNFLVEDKNTSSREYISFVGRISKYKGIDLFLKAIPIVTNEFPEQRFLIAGKTLFGYNLDTALINSLKGNLVVIEKHLSNSEVVNLISKSKVVICPYLDATQSGVILTSYALNTPVIVTNTGGLPEYIIPSLTGSVTKSNTAEGLANEIIEFLKGENDKCCDSPFKGSDLFQKDRENNLAVYQNIYSC